MKILSFQPFSLYANGGGSRILRRLYEGNEEHVHSLVVKTYSSKKTEGAITETIILVSPILKPWMKWHLRNITLWYQKHFSYSCTIKRLQTIAVSIPHDIIHATDHGIYSAALCDYAKQNNKQLWVSFHDHFKTSGGSEESTKKLWHQASRRLLISNELGREYCRLLGNKDFQIITDGLKETEIIAPKLKLNDPISIYFAGLLHIDYVPLFQVLFHALNELSTMGYRFNLILRGTQHITFPKKELFSIVYKPFTLNEEELKEEMHKADILYLPIKFSDNYFYQYSLSTKMIGYLGAPGAILYHGPEDSAANFLLSTSDSAIGCHNLDSQTLLKKILLLIDNNLSIISNAKHIAINRFSMDKIKNLFWEL
ncbi:glycosyltransferase family protein [Spirosoma validum]|uniref:Glycosyltransferase family 4 protein n=1 Tax=Spirosoma validum TaxID=2771355 RepID=A0A927B0S3_9BACT|nr:hypothetical protein [Spirosoma validum]MBD2753313.1 hypothetical protein [Spirosoma validum]